MPTTATIESVEFVNSFPSQYGDANGQLHSYFYRFSDGAEGEANHKAAPSWAPGDEVDYTVTGEHNGVNKLKVSKVGGQQGRPQEGGNRPPARSGPSGGQRQPPAQQRPATGKGVPLGVTVGMALNNAALDMRALPAAGFLHDGGLAKKWLWERASLYLRLSQEFEAGKIAPLPRGEPLPTDAPRSEPVRQAAPPPRAQPERPRPGPDGAVDTSDADESVPF